MKKQDRQNVRLGKDTGELLGSKARGMGGLTLRAKLRTRGTLDGLHRRCQFASSGLVVLRSCDFRSKIVAAANKFRRAGISVVDIDPSLAAASVSHPNLYSFPDEC